ncbi:hypothetical protein ACHAWF_017507, partial [Thalassiosira exigua]
QARPPEPAGGSHRATARSIARNVAIIICRDASAETSNRPSPIKAKMDHASQPLWRCGPERHSPPSHERIFSPKTRGDFCHGRSPLHGAPEESCVFADARSLTCFDFATNGKKLMLICNLPLIERAPPPLLAPLLPPLLGRDVVFPRSTGCLNETIFKPARKFHLTSHMAPHQMDFGGHVTTQRNM